MILYDASGQPVDVGDEDPHDRVASGELGFAPDQMVPAINPEGKPVYIKPTDLGDALQTGYRVTTDNVVNDFKQAQEDEKEMAGLGGHVLAATSGLLGAPTFGLGQKAVTGLAGLLGGDASQAGAARTMSAAKEAHPLTYMGAELGGIAAQMAMTGGAGTAVEGAEAASVAGRLGEAAQALKGVNLAGAAAKVGEAAEVGVRGLMGTERAATALGRLTQAATRLGVEGSRYGAGQEVSEAALGNRDISAQALVASGALGAGANILGGALLEGGAAAARAGWSKLTGKPTAKEAAAVLSEVLGERVDERIGQSWLDRMASSDAAKLGGRKDAQEAMATMAQRTPEGAALRAAAKDKYVAEDAISTAARDSAEAMDRVRRADLHAGQEFRGELKAQDIRRTMSDGGIGEVAGAADEFLTTTRQELADVFGGEIPKGGAAGKMSRVLDNAEREITDALNAGDKSEAYMVLDRLKRDAQKITKGAAGKGLSQDDMAGRAIDAAQDRLRVMLEREHLWGGAGKLQKDVNAAWHAKFTADENTLSSFAKKFGKDEFDWRFRGQRFDPGSVESYLKGIGQGEGQTLNREAVHGWLDAQEHWLQTAKTNISLGPKDAETVNEGLAAVAAARKQLQEAEKQSLALNQLRRLDELEQRQTLGRAALTSGLKELAWVRDKFMTAERFNMIAKLRGAQDAIAEKMSGKVGAYIKKAAEAGATAARGAARGTSATASAAVRQQASGARASGEPRGMAHERAQFAKSVDAIRSTNPEAAASHVETSLGRAAVHAPQTALAVHGVAMAAADFLRSKLPPAAQAVNPMMPGVKPPPASDVEVAAFNRYVRAVTDPMSVLDDLQAGQLPPEGKEALKAVYPALWQQIGNEFTQRLAERKTPLPYQQAIQLSAFLERPLDPTMTPQFIAAMQANAAKPPPPQNTPATPGHQLSRKLNVAQGVATATQHGA